jgi:adenosylmethionine-8-amino-7-oxononanoate aminotransferase
LRDNTVFMTSVDGAAGVDFDPSGLRDVNARHQLHPVSILGDDDTTVIVRGKGCRLWDAEGREYLDTLSGLWNVAVGHGREELAEAAAAQMRQLAYYSAYAPFSNAPAIALAERLVELTGGAMQYVYFVNSGAEANETAFKIARLYWRLQGKPDKFKIVGRERGYHGGTMAATSATGLPGYWAQFEPRVPGFAHAASPYRYRCRFCQGQPGCTLACADDVETVIQREGADSVAAFIGEPIQGAGGVVSPPHPDYWARVRQITRRHQVLLIADEVITGFGRTGRWFAQQRWPIDPDITTVAKAITSGYLPLSATMMSADVRETLREAPPNTVFMHGNTYTAHPTTTAVALRNLQIIEDEKLVERADHLGPLLLAALEPLRDLPLVGDVRGGPGPIAAIELVADKDTKEPLPSPGKTGRQVAAEGALRGLAVRPLGDTIAMCPPLITSEEDLRAMVAGIGESIEAVGRAGAS